MTRLLVLTAVDLEAQTLARHLGLTAAGSAWTHFSGGSLEIVAVGVGARHLGQRGRPPGGPVLVVSAGLCGALAPELAAGALVVPEAVLGADGRRRPTAAVAGARRHGTLLTVDRVLEDAAGKARRWLETGALAADMESAPIMDWAADRGLPALVVRGVSDPAERGVPADLARAVHADGRVSPMRAVTAMLARPGAIADAIALRTATTSALKIVAATLGTLSRSL